MWYFDGQKKEKFPYAKYLTPISGNFWFFGTNKEKLFKNNAKTIDEIDKTDEMFTVYFGLILGKFVFRLFAGLLERIGCFFNYFWIIFGSNLGIMCGKMLLSDSLGSSGLNMFWSFGPFHDQILGKIGQILLLDSQDFSFFLL